uniref:Putative secreted protein n=1 Tax=Anopheles darlingi TaxID=43151 RepID=A0A2M4D3Q9_ANODA
MVGVCVVVVVWFRRVVLPQNCDLTTLQTFRLRVLKAGNRALHPKYLQRRIITYANMCSIVGRDSISMYRFDHLSYRKIYFIAAKGRHTRVQPLSKAV